MNLHKKLRKLFREVEIEARTNSAFAERLVSALGGSLRDGKAHNPGEMQDSSSPAESKRSNRREKAALDPHAVYRSEGLDALRQRLASLSVEELKNIVAEFAMDHSKLALKWKTPDRLVTLIIDTVVSRSKKGEAFMPRSEPPSADGNSGTA